MLFENVPSFSDRNKLCVDLLRNSTYAPSKIAQILLQIEAVKSVSMTDDAKTEILDELTIELYCEKLNTELQKIDDPPYPISNDKSETIYPAYYMKEQVDDILDLQSLCVEKFEGIDRFFTLGNNRSLKNSALNDDRFAVPGESERRPFYLLEDYAVDLMSMCHTKLQGKALYRWIMNQQ